MGEKRERKIKAFNCMCILHLGNTMVILSSQTVDE